MNPKANFAPIFTKHKVPARLRAKMEDHIRSPHSLSKPDQFLVHSQFKLKPQLFEDILAEISVGFIQRMWKCQSKKASRTSLATTSR